MKKISLVLLLVSSVSAFARWDGLILDVAAKKPLKTVELFDRLAPAENIVLGEKHYTAPVQKAEGEIIEGAVRAAKREGHFTVGWEFLNRTSRDKTAELYRRFSAGEITGETFLKTTQGSEQAVAYLPVMRALKALDGELIGVNLSREEKKPAVQGGLAAMDPKLVPPSFQLGGTKYHDRFVEAMGGHGGPALANYFVAQCLTDATMAHALLTEAKHAFRFLVAGAFHADYHDGAVAELYARGNKERTVSISIVDASDYTEADMYHAVYSAKYGPIADYVFFVNEPQAGSVK